ncbi:MAG: circularly permuted type 2 ATP-grasp protein [Burkholderiaceae bacterium]
MQDDLFANYDQQGFYCELFGSSTARAEHTSTIRRRLARMKLSTLKKRARATDTELFNMGITFTVYTEREAIDRVLPFDVIPRVISNPEWRKLEAGCKQRVQVLNLFLHDIYHDQRVLRDGIVPAELVLGNANYREQMRGFTPPGGTYVHVCGVDLVRDGQGEFRVLEDNARTPSGVSYVVENRHLMLRLFPDLTDRMRIMPVSDYGVRLRKALSEVAPADTGDPRIALLTPGIYNSAYFEHVFLAREMGAALVEGRDLFVDDDRLYMKTTSGPVRIDVLYRRVDDDFIDPEVFREDSVLGVPGLMRAYMAGGVTLANAVGTGVADDKAIYAYMPAITRYYLDQDPIIANVPTNICREPDALAYTLAHLDELVTKPVGESGGYGVVVGPRASKSELEALRASLQANPERFISQPLIELSVCPTVFDRAIEPRHVDLRPYIVTGQDSWVLPGGLTRVALRKGSFVVNSSQGGGTKDTWVLG